MARIRHSLLTAAPPTESTLLRPLTGSGRASGVVDGGQSGGRSLQHERCLLKAYIGGCALEDIHTTRVEGHDKARGASLAQSEEHGTLDLGVMRDGEAVRSSQPSMAPMHTSEPSLQPLQLPGSGQLFTSFSAKYLLCAGGFAIFSPFCKTRACRPSDG